MNFKIKDIFLNVSGFFLIALGLVAIFNSFSLGNYAGVLWFCYWALVLIGLGVFFRNGFLIESQLNILTIPLFFWSMDFFSILFFNYSPFGVAGYFFDASFPLFSKFISFQHVWILPLSFISLFLIKNQRRDSWKFSSLQIILFYIITVLFTNPERNINCVFESCISFVGNNNYGFVWFVLFLSMIFLINILINQFKIFKK